jgi:hypothetical protein
MADSAPDHTIHPLAVVRATISVVMSVIGKASGQLVKWLMHTRR